MPAGKQNKLGQTVKLLAPFPQSAVLHQHTLGETGLVIRMFGEIIRATILGALPVACFTFLTLQWSIASGRLPKFTDKKDLKAQYKKLSQAAKEAKKKAKEEAKKKKELEASEPEEKKPFFHKGKGGDLLHGKVMFFGGGFYGTMALFTYLIVEIDEITNFLGKIVDFEHWRFSFSIDFIIDLIINSIINMVQAFIWFDTLPEYVRVNEGWIWLIAAYLGYLSGIRFTRDRGDETWEKMSGMIASIKEAIRGKLPSKATTPNENNKP